ncbi:MAG TPA: EAL domain-containing protein, partial [Pirellulaceae bacterium]|nr:EAL domain-containing protein [Pirellulaceae bacterium]
GKTLDVLESDPSSAGALQQMWETISSGRPWAGRMRNRRRKQPANTPTDLIPTDKTEEYWADVSITPLTNDDGSIDGYVAVQRDVSAEVEREEQLSQAARTDRLTGLGNRLSVQSCLQRALDIRKRRPDYQFALMFLDLDRFKVINDSLGHHVGDLLLQEVAKRLGETLRSSDYVLRPSDMRGAARWGGDEFVVLIDEYQRTEDVALVAERIQRVLAEPYHLAGRTVLTSASIGVVDSSGPYSSADEMLRDADTAMYEAKSRGKACWVMFDVSMQKAVQRRLQIETELRTALHEKQFYLLYQPIVSVQDGSLQGVEALVRWEHPTRGLISPSEFIPIAEESRAISDLGRWILEEACRQWTTWQRTRPERTPPYIAINVSRIQIADHEFVDQVRHILHLTGMEPRRLVIEVTESTVMRDHAQAQATLNELRSLGIRLAIDDFGAGYSSLSCLHQFPFDILKIDRSFLSNFQQSEQLIVLTQAIVNLAMTLGLECIAEGIENAEQQQALLLIGCPSGQGFYYGKPHAPNSIIEGDWRAVHSPSSSSGTTLPAITMDTAGTWLPADRT